MYSTGQKHVFTMRCINAQRIIVVIKLQINLLAAKFFFYFSTPCI